MDRADLTLLAPMMPRQQTDRSQNVPSIERVDADGRGRAPQVEPVTAEDVDNAVATLNDFVQVVRRDLQFSVDETSGRTVITVLDSETEEVVRQIPPERLVAAAENVQRLQGLLFEAEA
jgi:flagellar protein FlaG